jgi:hypothetical protein
MQRQIAARRGFSCVPSRGPSPSSTAAHPADGRRSLGLSRSRSTSGVRCRCPAQRPAPLAQTIRYCVTGSGTPFSFICRATRRRTVRPPDAAPAPSPPPYPGPQGPAANWPHAPKAVARTREALGAARPRPPMGQGRGPVPEMALRAKRASGAGGPPCARAGATAQAASAGATQAGKGQPAGLKPLNASRARSRSSRPRFSIPAAPE